MIQRKQPVRATGAAVDHTKTRKIQVWNSLLVYTLVQDSFVEPCLAALPYSLWGTVAMSVGVPEQLLEEATATGDLNVVAAFVTLTSPVRLVRVWSTPERVTRRFAVRMQPMTLLPGNRSGVSNGVGGLMCGDRTVPSPDKLAHYATPVTELTEWSA